MVAIYDYYLDRYDLPLPRSFAQPAARSITTTYCRSMLIGLVGRWPLSARS